MGPCTQRNNIEVVVLEARERLGGRVHSYRGNFSCAVDLGASIITGTQVRLDYCSVRGPPPHATPRGGHDMPDSPRAWGTG